MGCVCTLPSLQEGFDLYYEHAEDGLKSVADMSAFFRKLATAEASYAKKLAEISKTIDPKLWRKTDKELG